MHGSTFWGIDFLFPDRASETQRLPNKETALKNIRPPAFARVNPAHQRACVRAIAAPSGTCGLLLAMLLAGFGCSHPRAFPSVRVPPPPSEDIRAKLGNVALVTAWVIPTAQFQNPLTVGSGAGTERERRWPTSSRTFRLSLDFDWFEMWRSLPCRFPSYSLMRLRIITGNEGRGSLTMRFQRIRNI